MVRFGEGLLELRSVNATTYDRKGILSMQVSVSIPRALCLAKRFRQSM